MSDLLSVSPFQRSLDYHAERHNVIASNIANANTPAFRPMELLRVEEDELLRGSLPMKRTEQTHMLGSGVPGLHELEVVDDESSLGGLDGNTVSVEREMSKLQANDLRYQGAVRLVTRQLAMLRYASNDGSSSG
jgi:flagellar basal-body rod protein FlgB